MSLIASPITGQESPANTDSPYAALVQFYRAFNGRDMESMANNWLQSDEASLSNPVGGGVRRGWNAIAALYDRLFNGAGRVYVEFFDYSLHQTGEMFVAVGRERGTFTSDDASLKLEIRTSRTYRWTNDGWRQLHHHGSIENAALLGDYQQAITRINR
ncbi:MAG: nuclear transport factor 2 family protein [Marinobacter sp.]|uniref:YybH family protein n=1 Tax=Marinobacter sp. TaxID=50741 RepID=UPI00299E16CB|nr:nuclear transport factor 2 family protein [Marinobacter sp.]MDX1757171.1 nuclear transport factor 2 family protein [Marinobacter sp.]